MTVSIKALLLYGASALLGSLSVIKADVVTYNWNVTTIDASGFDGVSAAAYGINNQPCHQFPIEVELGQEVEVSVTNLLNESTCMHWHGMKQLGTQEMDGTSEVTQCHIHPNQTAVYRFTPDKAGTFWWHSHHGAQYAFGLRGPLIVHPPAEQQTPWEAEVDEEITVQLADWYHAYPKAPVWDTVLINNRGTYNCTAAANAGLECNPDQPLSRFQFETGKLYRLRLINMAGLAPFNFSIDDHDFQVIAADGENLAPTGALTHLVINAGQRYDLLVKAKDTTDSFWMRATGVAGLPWTGMGADVAPEGFNANGLAIVDYSDDVSIVPCSQPHAEISTISEYDLVPITPTTTTLPTTPDQRVVVEFNLTFADNKVHGVVSIDDRGFNSFEAPDVPPLFTIASGMTTAQLPNNTNAAKLDFGSHVEIVLVNDMVEQHPFHLHSHTPWVVGHGTASREDIANSNLTGFNLQNPIKRDVYTVPACDMDENGACVNLGYLVLRFDADSPGVWMMHCHIDWHMDIGLAMVFVEGEEELQKQGVDQFADSILSVCKSDYSLGTAA